jgi:hypothetical protein
MESSSTSLFNSVKKLLEGLWVHVDGRDESSSSRLLLVFSELLASFVNQAEFHF